MLAELKAKLQARVEETGNNKAYEVYAISNNLTIDQIATIAAEQNHTRMKKGVENFNNGKYYRGSKERSLKNLRGMAQSEILHG